MSTEIGYINHVVIGAGINVNQDTFPDDIKATASSLKLELGKSVKRSELIAAVMKSFLPLLPELFFLCCLKCFYPKPVIGTCLDFAFSE